MKRIFRSITLFLSACMLLLAISGCGSSGDKTTGTTGSQAGSGETATAVKEATALSMFTFSEGVKDVISKSDVWKTIMNNTGVNVELEAIAGMQADEKRSVMIASGEYPDILDRIDERFIDAAALLPLDDLIDQYGPNIKKAWGDSLNKLRSPKDGKIYFIGSPKNRPEEIAEPGPALMIQYDVLEKTGYPQIKTLDDVFNVLKEYTSKYKDIDGKSFIPWGIWADSWGYNHTVNNPALWTNGFTDDSDAYVDQKTYDVTYFNATDHFKDYLKFLNKLYKNNLLDKNGFITKIDEFNSQVANGRVLAAIYHTALISESEAALRQAGMPERCYARFPIIKDSSIVDRSQVYCESYDTGMGITVDCKDPAKAIQFIDYLVSVEGNVLLNWGIEGIHYDVVDGKRVQKEEVSKAWNSNPDYRWQQGINCLTWWPQYNGAIVLDDGDYASPFNVNTTYASYDSETKKVLDQYKVKNWGQLFDTSGHSTPYGFAWTIPIESGSAAELANTKANELRHIMVGEIVMSPDDGSFENKWDTFKKKLYDDCKIADWEKAMSESIKTRLKLWKIIN